MANKKHKAANGKPAKKKATKKKRRKRLAPVKKEHKSVTRVRNEEVIKKLAIVFGAFIVILVITLFVLGLGVLVLDRLQGKQETIVLPASQTIEPVVESEVKSGFLDTEDPKNQQRFDELRIFWEEVLSSMVQDNILKGRAPLPAISQRISVLQGQIVGRFDKPYDIDVILNYSETGNRRVQCHSGVKKDKTPVLMILVASIQDYYNELRKSGALDWQQMFFNKMIISLEHELDHLAISLMTELQSVNGRALTLEELVDGEAEVWHYSCLYVIGPMIENSLPIDNRMKKVYQAWLRCGKQADSTCWKMYIRREKVQITRN